MSLTGMVYRPPYEANSLLLQVTQGCSHNKCTFCYMYPDVRFSVCPTEQVEADIEEDAHCCPDVERVFLEHGDAFVLPADCLIQIADVIHAKLPKVKSIAIPVVRMITEPTMLRLKSACAVMTGWISPDAAVTAPWQMPTGIAANRQPFP